MKIIKRLKKLKKAERAGFTLIEIIVVMAIISILSGIMLPNFTGFINKMNADNYKVKMNSIHTAARLTHEKEEPLNEKRIIKHSNILNIKVGEEYYENFYTVSKDPETGVVYVRYLSNNGRKHTYSTFDMEDWASDIVDPNSPKPEPPIEEPVNQALLFDFDESRGILQGLTLTGREHFGERLEIPEQINGVDVVIIKVDAFRNNGLNSVKIPNTVIIIEDGAFMSNNLMSVVVPEGLTTIKANAFRNNNLSLVVLPTTLISLGEKAFYDNGGNYSDILDTGSGLAGTWATSDIDNTWIKQ